MDGSIASRTEPSSTQKHIVSYSVTAAAGCPILTAMSAAATKASDAAEEAAEIFEGLRETGRHWKQRSDDCNFAAIHSDQFQISVLPKVRAKASARTPQNPGRASSVRAL